MAGFPGKFLILSVHVFLSSSFIFLRDDNAKVSLAFYRKRKIFLVFVHIFPFIALKKGKK